LRGWLSYRRVRDTENPQPFRERVLLLYGGRENGMQEALKDERGFSLLEVLIAAVVVVILLMAFLGSVVASFLADAGSQNSNSAVNLARKTMEEVMGVPFQDALAMDGDTILTPEGLAVRISVVQTGVTLALVEVSVSRPVPMLTLGDLQVLGLDEFRRMPSASGSQFNLVCMKHKP
jgi:prepilin-type N-terminal cleavage/methylation domain-containing protein